MNTCGGCDSTWSGAGMAHCASCHHTFAVVSSFDKHRSGGVCLHPKGRGLHQDERGVWRQPSREETG